MINIMPTSQREAKERNLKRYNDGKPCPHGHTSGKYASNGGCIECQRLGTKRYHDAGRDKPYVKKAEKVGKPDDFHHRGAPLRDFSESELKRDLSARSRD